MAVKQVMSYWDRLEIVKVPRSSSAIDNFPLWARRTRSFLCREISTRPALSAPAMAGTISPSGSATARPMFTSDEIWISSPSMVALRIGKSRIFKATALIRKSFIDGLSANFFSKSGRRPFLKSRSGSIQTSVKKNICGAVKKLSDIRRAMTRRIAAPPRSPAAKSGRKR